MEPEQVVNKIVRFLGESCRVVPGDRGLLAISGGGDSTALMLLMSLAKERLGLTLSVAIVDHRLRPEAREEALLVRSRARALGFESTIVSVDAAERARHDRRSIEEAARLERHEALEAERCRCGAAWIALGHTLNDQAETVLQRIHRGTGLDGLACMVPRSDRLIRPLLWAERGEVRELLEHLGQEWIDDPSNVDRRYERVLVRQDLVKHLDASKLATTAAEAARASTHLTRGDAAWLRSHSKPFGDSGSTVIGAESLPGPIRRRACRAALQAASVAFLPSRERTAAISAAARGGGREVQFPGGVALRGAGGAGLALTQALPEPPSSEELRISSAGRFRSEALRLSVEVGRAVPGSPLWGTVDGSAPFQIRPRRPGDTFVTSGRSTKRRLARQQPWQPLRDWIPIVSRGHSVLWSALDPRREAGAPIVSLILDADHPLRVWAASRGLP